MIGVWIVHGISSSGDRYVLGNAQISGRLGLGLYLSFLRGYKDAHGLFSDN